jgi:hypothetical protein
MFKKIFLFLALISAVGVSNHSVWAVYDPNEGGDGGRSDEPQSVLDKLIAGISGEDSWLWECEADGENCVQVWGTLPPPVPEAPTPTSDQPPDEEPPVCNPEDPEDESPPAEEESNATSDGSYSVKAKISSGQLYKFLHAAPSTSYPLAKGLIMTINKKATATNTCTAEIMMDVTFTHKDGHVTRGSLKMNRNGARLKPIPINSLK